MSFHDEALSMRVREALGQDKRVSDLPINVRVSGSDVYLKGTVDSLEQLAVIQFVIEGLSGVRHINTDEIEVREEIG